MCDYSNNLLYLCSINLETMKNLSAYMSTLLLVIAALMLPSACTLPWSQEDDEFDITSKFKATWNVHEKFERNSDGSITYHSVSYGGLVGLVKEHNLPVDWSDIESITFEFADSTKVETQIMLGSVMRTYGRPGIKKLTCYFDGLDMRQVDQVVLQTAQPTTLTVTSVKLSPASISWDSQPIWEGECLFNNWEGGFVIPPEPFATALEGDKLEFLFTTDTSDPKRGYWLIKSVYNTTDQTLEGNSSEQNQWGCTMVGQEATSYRLRMSAKDVKELKKKGLFVNGYYLKVTQVNLLRKGVSGQSKDEKKENEGENEEEKEKYNQWQ